MGPSPDDLPDEIRDSLSDLENGNLTETEVERLLVRFAELVSWGSCIDVLSKEASLRAIIKMMRRWPLNETIQVSGCQILGSIAARGEEQRRLICRLGGVTAVVEALKKHPRAVAVQEKGCWALRQLTVDSQCRREVLIQRGIDAVVEALRQHPGAMAVLEGASMALANLAVDAEIDEGYVEEVRPVSLARLEDLAVDVPTACESSNVQEADDGSIKPPN